MKFELRTLKSDDLFPMFSILSKIGFQDLKDLLTPEKLKDFNQDSENTTMLGMSVVMELVSVIMQNLPSCKDEIYKFLSGLSGMSIKEISNLDIATFTEMIIAVVQKTEFKDFFKVVSKLFK